MKLNRNDFEQEKAVFSIEQKENFSKIAKICHALSSEIRLEIIRQLQYEPMTLPELAKKNFLSTTAAVYHMECLYESGLIDIVYEPTSHGKIRVCHRMLNDFYINLRLIENEKEKPNEQIVTYTMGVGQFVNCEGSTDCSFVTKDKLYHTSWDNIYIRERFDADLFYSTNGTVTYAFPSNFATMHNCKEFSISLEICSEALGYNMNWKSDITFWINDVELFTYTSPSDFGGRQGLLNPEWWTEGYSQYGELKTIQITENGIFLDGIIMNTKITLKDLNLNSSAAVYFKLGNKKDAINVGGYNIFGKGFGDYPQDIVLKAKYKD